MLMIYQAADVLGVSVMIPHIFILTCTLPPDNWNRYDLHRSESTKTDAV